MKAKVNKKELIKMISESSGYHSYEVTDVLNHLVLNFHSVLLEDKQLKIDGIGTFSQKKCKPRNFTSSLTGQTYEIKTSPSVSLKPDSVLRNVLKEQEPEE